MFVWTHSLLAQDFQDNEEAKKLDACMEKYALITEDNLPNRFQYDYSEEIVQQRDMVKIRKLQQSQLLTNIDHTEQIKVLQFIHNVLEMETPTTAAEAHLLHSQAVKVVKESQQNHQQLQKQFLDKLIDELSTKKD